MGKRSVLIVAQHLTIGGVQRSLISALNAIDYKENDVTLHLRKNRLNLMPYINENVKIEVNKDIHHYYRRPYALWLQIICAISKLLRIKNYEKNSQDALKTYILEQRMHFEKKRFFGDDVKFDVAIAYSEGYTAQFVADYVKATRKIVFYHVSSDENHGLHERIFSEFDKIVGVNAGIRNMLRKLYPQYADQITYLDNYVDAQPVLKKSRERKIETVSDRITLCSCGRMAPVKGFDLAIEAARVLKERGDLFTWYFVGDGPERAKLEKMLGEYDLSDCVEITGIQDNPYPWMAACDVYIQPSYEEAQPLSIIESKILCKPVVSTTTVGGRQLVKDGIDGLLSEINAEDLADKIEKLMKDEGLRVTIGAHLAEIDYSKDYEKYQMGWRRLLEG